MLPFVESPRQHGHTPVAAQAAHGYTLFMRWHLLLVPLALAACTLPGRQTFAPNPVGADTQSISATQAFAGRVPLVSILPDTRDFAAPLKAAVDQAVAIKPNAEFEVQAQAPAAATPDASAAALAALAPEAKAVAQAIVADGVPQSRVALTAKTAGLDPLILVYVK